MKDAKRALKQELSGMGVRIRIKTVARGGRNPIANNDTAQGRAKNRRATIKIT